MSSSNFFDEPGVLSACLLVSLISEFRTQISSPQNPGWEHGTYPCLLVEEKKSEFHTTPLSPPAATFDALILMNQARGTVETLQRIPPGLPNNKPRPEMAHSGCRHHRLQLHRRRIIVIHTLNSLIISNCPKPFGPKPGIQHNGRGRGVPTLT
jgi:hypothetical protein